MIHSALDLFLHLDRHLNAWAGNLGPWLYVVLFLIIFCETGLIITPYLPGDSLLFAVGALAAKEGSPINLALMVFCLGAAAILGDATNYHIGRWASPRIFSRETSRLLNKEHLHRTHRFFEKYGGKTIILARFIPVIRTFAPFVAGLGGMNYSRFALFNVTGGVAWTLVFLLAGHHFANLPMVKEHFHYVILAIIFISIMPAVFEILKNKAPLRHEAEEGLKD